jgi:NodT family efflux transporter outer membrane factor (OMF) lipoprotein
MKNLSPKSLSNAGRLCVLAATFAAMFIAGCTVGPKYRQPAATVQPPPGTYKESPTQFPDSDAWKVAEPKDAMLHGKWWELYNDPELNALEEQLNINNQNIKQAFENFMASRTLVSEAHAQLFPTVGITPAFQRSRTSGNLSSTPVGSSSGAGGPTVTPKFETGVYSLPASASWEPDLWGKVRNTIHEAQYNAQLSAADLENERLSEQASLATFLFELRGQDALQKVFDETIEADKISVELAKARYETGVDDQLSLVQAQNALESAQAAGTNLGLARAQFEHAIAVLIGVNPSGFSIAVKPLNASAPAIPLGLPSQLLERRPDIAASERSMAAANAQIGIAVAAYYPNLNINVGAGFESATVQKLLAWPSRIWSVGPSLSETVFDAGLRRATVMQFTATYNANVAGYRQTVLAAFQQVEDSLAAVRILSAQIQQQAAAEQSAERFLELAKARYFTGVDTYLNVLVAQTTLLADQQSLASLRTQEMTASVQLIEALGGGWDRSQLPTPAQVSKRVTRSEIEPPKP